MVADDRTRKEESIEKFDSSKIVHWTREFKMSLKASGRGEDEGLLDPPVRPANNAAAAKHLEFKKEFREWTNRNSGIVGKLWTACKQEKIAHDIIIRYAGEKEELPDNDPDKTMLGSEILRRLIVEFKDSDMAELGKWQAKFTSFRIVEGEKITEAMSRLDTIIQELRHRDEEPSASSKYQKITSAIALVKELAVIETILSTISDENSTYEFVCKVCRKYQYNKDKKDEDDHSPEPEVHSITEGGGETSNVVCSYEHCGKKGHTAKECRTKARHLREQSFKRKGRGGGTYEKAEGKGGKGKGKGSTSIICYTCGEKGHKSFECEKRVHAKRPADEDEDHRPQKRKGNRERGWGSYVDDDEDDDEVNMMGFDSDSDVSPPSLVSDNSSSSGPSIQSFTDESKSDGESSPLFSESEGEWEQSASEDSDTVPPLVECSWEGPPSEEPTNSSQTDGVTWRQTLRLEDGIRTRLQQADVSCAFINACVERHNVTPSAERRSAPSSDEEEKVIEVEENDDGIPGVTTQQRARPRLNPQQTWVHQYGNELRTTQWLVRGGGSGALADGEQYDSECEPVELGQFPIELVDLTQDSSTSDAGSRTSEDTVESSYSFLGSPIIGEVNTIADRNEDRLYLDSGASKRIALVMDVGLLTQSTPIDRSIQLTGRNARLQVVATGSNGDWHGLIVAPSAIKNLISFAKMESMGYGVNTIGNKCLVDLHSLIDVLPVHTEDNGMIYCDLHDMFALPRSVA
jgi:hypothetical protein